MRYGWHGGTATAALLQDDLMQDQRLEYIANMLYAVTGAVYKMGGAELEVPAWSDLRNPPQQDRRTKKEIISDLRAKLIGKGAVDGCNAI